MDEIKNKQPDNVENTNYGVKYTFNTSIKGLNGKYEQANVIVVVQNDSGNITWKIVTLYPGKRKKIKMNELDNVILIKDFKNLKAGTKGAIVLKYNEKDFEVEFFDNKLNTIGVYTINVSYLKLDND